MDEEGDGFGAEKSQRSTVHVCVLVTCAQLRVLVQVWRVNAPSLTSQ